MKKTFLYLIVFIVVLSCKKEKELSFSERYEDEAYELINQQFLPYVDTINVQYNGNKFFKRKIYLITNEYHSEKNKYYLSHLIDSKIFTKEEVDLNEKNKIRNWNKDKLFNTIIIDSVFFKRVDSINKIKRKFVLIHEDPLSQKRDKELFDLGKEFFKIDIGEPLFTISSPFFNKEFNKAVYYFNGIESFIGCGGISDYQYFEKHNGVWKQVIKDE